MANAYTKNCQHTQPHIQTGGQVQGNYVQKCNTVSNGYDELKVNCKFAYTEKKDHLKL